MGDLSRRNALQCLATLPLTGREGTPARPALAQDRLVQASRTLVAFVSRTGNTRVIAGQIRRAHSADIFESASAMPYPEDYQETAKRDPAVERAVSAPLPSVPASHPAASVSRQRVVDLVRDHGLAASPFERVTERVECLGRVVDPRPAPRLVQK